MRSLDTIDLDRPRRDAESIAGLRKVVMELRDNFNELVQTAEDPRLRRDGRACADKLAIAGNAVERIINKNMTWMADGRRHEIDDGAAAHARNTKPSTGSHKDELASQQFFVAYKQFTGIFARSTARRDEASA